MLAVQCLAVAWTSYGYFPLFDTRRTYGNGRDFVDILDTHYEWASFSFMLGDSDEFDVLSMLHLCKRFYSEVFLFKYCPISDTWVHYVTMVTVVTVDGIEGHCVYLTNHIKHIQIFSSFIVLYNLYCSSLHITTCFCFGSDFYNLSIFSHFSHIQWME